MDDYLVELESCRSEAPSITLETDLTSCPVCLIGEPKEINRSTKSKIIVYTRDGTLLAEHKEKRCNNRNCRVGAYYGYIVIRGGDRIYLPNCLNNEEHSFHRCEGSGWPLEPPQTKHQFWNGTVFFTLVSMTRQCSPESKHDYKADNVKTHLINGL